MTHTARGANDARAEELSATLDAIYRTYRSVDEGKVADYIPELARADPNWFAIAVVTTDGEVFERGDSTQSFTIQSASRPFVYGLALEDHGRDQVLSRVGVEPSGEALLQGHSGAESPDGNPVLVRIAHRIKDHR